MNFQKHYEYYFCCKTCCIAATTRMNAFQAKLHKRAYKNHEIVLNFGDN